MRYHVFDHLRQLIFTSPVSSVRPEYQQTAGGPVDKANSSVNAAALAQLLGSALAMPASAPAAVGISVDAAAIMRAATADL
eukprot:2639329-Prymnesium_polylepis.1